MNMDHFLDTYRKLKIDTLHMLDDIYDSDIHFIDAVHETRGLEELRNYFSRLYEKIESIDFQFFSPIHSGNEGYVHWTMRYSHEKISGGSEISVHGASFLRFSEAGKVIYHRDFFDLGQMVYQHLPILGPVIRTVNRRIGS